MSEETPLRRRINALSRDVDPQPRGKYCGFLANRMTGNICSQCATNIEKEDAENIDVYMPNNPPGGPALSEAPHFVLDLSGLQMGKMNDLPVEETASADSRKETLTDDATEPLAIDKLDAEEGEDICKDGARSPTGDATKPFPISKLNGEERDDICKDGVRFLPHKEAEDYCSTPPNSADSMDKACPIHDASREDSVALPSHCKTVLPRASASDNSYVPGISGARTRLRSLWRASCNIEPKNTGFSGKLTIHSWAVVNATAPATSRWGSIGFLSISASVPLIVMIVAYSVFFDTLASSCVGHAQCDEGSACAPSTGGLYPPTLSPGRCLPCSVIQRLYSTSEHGGDVQEGSTFSVTSIMFLFRRREAEMARTVSSVNCPYCATGTTWLDSSRSRCEEWSGMAGCPPLLDRSNQVWHYPIFIVLVVLIIWSSSLLDELRDAGLNYKILVARMRTMRLSPEGKAAFLLIGRLIFLCRVTLVCTLALAAWGIMVGGSLKGSNIILNVVGLSYLAQVDDILTDFFTLQAQERVRVALEDERAKFVEIQSEWATIVIFLSYIVCVTTCLIARPYYFAHVAFGSAAEDMSCETLGIQISFFFLLLPTFVFLLPFYYCFVWRHHSKTPIGVKWRGACGAFALFLFFYVVFTNIFYGFIL
eukprot:GEMP01025600.1.p1 GENE.GEMP01025600.1~~GEMP01025600.1.p1  ORF type:complete len:652 (+),score=110.69 GEMP01025600.1:45-2000(+)